jgi:hypothetical protein
VGSKTLQQFNTYEKAIWLHYFMQYKLMAEYVTMVPNTTQMERGLERYKIRAQESILYCKSNL